MFHCRQQQNMHTTLDKNVESHDIFDITNCCFHPHSQPLCLHHQYEMIQNPYICITITQLCFANRSWSQTEFCNWYIRETEWTTHLKLLFSKVNICIICVDMLNLNIIFLEFIQDVSFCEFGDSWVVWCDVRATIVIWPCLTVSMN
jgi:hypothetical protein